MDDEAALHSRATGKGVGLLGPTPRGFMPLVRRPNKGTE